MRPGSSSTDRRTNALPAGEQGAAPPAAGRGCLPRGGGPRRPAGRWRRWRWRRWPEGPSAEDLADIFGLELDQLRNQYETLQRGQQEQAATEVDETAGPGEGARRAPPAAENERLRNAMGSQVRSDGSGAAQRQLAEETLEEARRLERLSREQSRPELAESARQLREAAAAMQRAAANARSGNTGATPAGAWSGSRRHSVASSAIRPRVRRTRPPTPPTGPDALPRSSARLPAICSDCPARRTVPRNSGG